MLTAVTRAAAGAASHDTEGEASDDAWFTDWRARELSGIARAGVTYLDYTGAALYPESLVRADAERLATTLLANPHSQSTASRDATRDVEQARASILDFLRADRDEYTVVLTAYASGACRLVGEAFPFRDGSVLALAQDNHNSVNGIREFASARGARQVTLPLDAASYLATADVDLRAIHPDFVCLSLYKIAGYPTGVGALVARREALAQLQRPWFAGGTVQWVSVRHQRRRLVDGAEGFDDGTVPFLAAGAVAAALQAVRDAGRSRLPRHLARLTSHLLAGLTSARHPNGSPGVRIHGPEAIEARGPTVAFSLLDAHGVARPYWKVEDEARDAGIALRGGCFCNPGCPERAFGFDDRPVLACLESLGNAFTIPAFAHCMSEGTVGALRVALGCRSVMADVERLLAFVSASARSA